MSKTILPIIKWTGTKRYVAEKIVSKFPDEMDTYYEPFIGSGAIVAKFLESGKKYNKIVCSDINPDLIGLWALIKNNPNYLYDYYVEYSNKLKSLSSISEQRAFFVLKREEFNFNKTPELFFCLGRTSYGGLVRYNSSGNFNSSFHINRSGIIPNRLKNILKFWHELVQPIEFKCCDYKQIQPNENDFIFLDSPYFNMTSPIYYGKINYDDYCNYIRSLKCKYAMTLDGYNEDNDNTIVIPKDIYKTHEYMEMGVSSFRKLQGNNNMVHESLYLNY